MFTRVSVTTLTMLTTVFAVTQAYSESNMGRGQIRFASKNELTVKKGDEPSSPGRFAKFKVVQVADEKPAYSRPKFSSRESHSGSNALRSASGDHEEAKEKVVVQAGNDQERSITSDEIIEPTSWMHEKVQTFRKSCCQVCGEENCGCRGAQIAFFASGLYIRPGNVDLVYSIEQTGCDPVVDTPTGQLGIVSPDYDIGIRIGAAVALDKYCAAYVSATRFESSTTDSLTASDTNVLHSTVTHQNTGVCVDGSLFATANYDVDFDMIDVGLARVIRAGQSGMFRALGGVRFTRLQENFMSIQTVTEDLGETTVDTDIDFEGVGLSLGLDGQMQVRQGISFYGRGLASCLGGESKADYHETSEFGDGAVVAADFDDYRLVTVLEAEVGVGWQSKTGRWSANAGYQAMGFLGHITTSEFIHGFQHGSINDLGDVLTFSGFVLRAEARF